MSKAQDTIKELIRLPAKELRRKLIEQKEKLRLLRFDLVAGKVKNVREIRAIRKDIARLMSIIKLKNKTD